MTTIAFDRSGGAFGNELHLDLNLDGLSEYEAQRLEKMIEDVDFFNIPKDLAGSSSADEFHYVITIDDGVSYHAVNFTDTTMPKSLLLLVKELTLMRILH